MEASWGLEPSMILAARSRVGRHLIARPRSSFRITWSRDGKYLRISHLSTYVAAARGAGQLKGLVLAEAFSRRKRFGCESWFKDGLKHARERVVDDAVPKRGSGDLARLGIPDPEGLVRARPVTALDQLALEGAQVGLEIAEK